MTRTAKTAMVIGVSTGVGFLGDVLMFSLAKSKGGKFRLHFPKGMELVQVLILGAITGVAIDFVVRQVENAVKDDVEKKIEQIAEQEKEKYYAGQVGGLPIAMRWSNTV